MPVPRPPGRRAGAPRAVAPEIFRDGDMSRGSDIPFPRLSPRMRPTRSLLAACLSLALLSLPSLGGALDPLAGFPEGSHVLPDGGIAVPEKRATPEWYTPELHAKVLAASAQGLLYNVAEDRPEAAGTNFLFIRPGAWMLTPSWCTMAFIFGAPGSHQIGSAGHCAKVGDRVVIVAAPSLLAAIGTVKTSRDNGVGDDYSLTLIDAQWQRSVDPNVAGIWGPQGGTYTGTATLTSPQPVKQFGHGTVMGTGGTPRVGLSPKMDARAFYTDIPTIGGDSGSPALIAGSPAAPLGQALGIHTHQVIYLNHPSIKAGTRLTVVPATVVMGDVVPTP